MFYCLDPSYAKRACNNSQNLDPIQTENIQSSQSQLSKASAPINLFMPRPIAFPQLPTGRAIHPPRRRFASISFCQRSLLKRRTGLLLPAQPARHRRPAAVVSGEYKGVDRFRGKAAEDTGNHVGLRWCPRGGVVRKNQRGVTAEFPLTIDNTALQVVPDYRLRARSRIVFERSESYLLPGSDNAGANAGGEIACLGLAANYLFIRLVSP